MSLYGRWEVVGSGSYRSGILYLPCRCSCGKERLVREYCLATGKSKSCGCLSVEITVARRLIHGNAKRVGPTQEYSAWISAKARCVNPRHRAYKDYGGRGITVCERWINNFPAFLSDMGPRPDGYSLDRIDNDGNYEPQNCRWASHSQQTRNKRNNRWMECGGRRMILADWAREMNTPTKNLSSLLKRKTIDRVLELQARNQLESDTLARQREQEAGSLRKDD